MAQGTYIGQAQINMQVVNVNDDYHKGDIVVFKSDINSQRYLVEGFNGDRVILRPLDKNTWSPRREWFVKEEA